MTNPLLTKLGKNQHGQRAEKRASKRLGGRQQPGSGSQDHSKGDIKLPDLLVEAKSTIHASVAVRLDWLQKISREAIAINREPALMLQFVDGQGRVAPDGGWVMISEKFFKELTWR